MKHNFKPKLLSYRQFSVMREIFKNGVALDEALCLYQNTLLSLANRGYLKINWEQEVVLLSEAGQSEMSWYQETPLGLLSVKNNPDSRKNKFAASLKGKTRKVAK